MGSSFNLRLRNASSSSLESLKRKASGRNLIDKSHMSTSVSAGNLPEQEEHLSSIVQEQVGHQLIVGVPTRHGHMLDSAAPSTIRMVSTKRILHDHASAKGGSEKRKRDFLLRDADTSHGPSHKPKTVLAPFCKYPIKKSPRKRSIPTTSADPPQSTEDVAAQDSLAQAVTPDIEEEDDRPIPGAFPTPPSKRKEAFIFGSDSAIAGISNEEFGIAGDAVLEEMNRKLKARGIASIGETLNKQQVLQQKIKSTEDSKYASKSRAAPQGRFGAAHAKQFARFVRPIRVQW